MSERKLILDLTTAHLPPRFPWWCPKRIPVREGQHFKDWDVCEEQMEDDWRDRFVAYLQTVRLGGGLPPDDMPIGMNRRTMPPGARIVDEKTGEVVFSVPGLEPVQVESREK